MSKYTSLIPPNAPILEPPDPVKVIGAVVTVIVSLSLVAIIVFLIAEFLTDPGGGTPIQARLPSMETEDDPNDENNLSLRKPFPTAEEIQSQFRIVTPPNLARIEGRWITVLCRWVPPKGSNEREPPVIPHLFCDNLLIPWTMTFGNDVWFARIKVSRTGKHHLRVLSQDLIVHVDDSGVENIRQGEKPRKPLIIHEGTDDPKRCGECHVIVESTSVPIHQRRGLTIGPLHPSEACFACHQPETVRERHSKLPEPAGNDCASCHRLHGQSRESVGE